MYAFVIVTGLMGVAINVAARGIEKRVLRWHPSVRNAVAA
jgi:ABC-type nitrate/sulfonate/bicarbonate transport system permease component